MTYFIYLLQMPVSAILEQGSKWTKTTLNYPTTAGNKELITSWQKLLHITSVLCKVIGKCL